MNRAFIHLLPLVLVGCVLRQPGGSTGGETDGGATSGGETSASGGGSGTTTAAPGPTTTGGVDATSAVTGSETSLPFIAPSDGGASDCSCDQWMQDCPPGRKCMPYSGDGDYSWESLKCVDVVPEPDGLYEPCSVFGSGVSGEDSCDVGLMCWDFVDGVGHCVGMCIGSPDAPDCADPAADCHVAADGALTLCLPMCNPLLQDCPGGDDCVPNPQDSSRFLCVFDGEDQGQVFDPCQYVDECAKGLFCQSPGSAVECDLQGLGCCVPFCDVSLAGACPGQGQVCLPWYVDDEAPPGFENVGVCGLP
ncbi:hypothetical protein [Nannocystis sp. SCPEA4]|uniref:hypothetical protein n=1 Tax=Nannocystis sp. SCPEA4 TaxID=2996787 RepID=UPI0022714610|nr:hypothetical protein [Nannocystis sp. SCPEA4]MCY1060931.1 hypothetical protein [Nannocystis sp. SCPEA4]